MSIETFDVYFSGALIKDHDPEQVKRKIGAMFKLEGDRLERLFSGKPIPIKRGVDMDRAIKYRVAFRDAGGLVDIVPAGEPAPVAKPAPAPRPAADKPPAESAAKPSPLTLAEGPMEAPTDNPGPEITVPDYALSTAEGFDLSDCAPEVTPQELPDISSLDLNNPGTQLDETPAPEPLEIDTAALELDAPGNILEEQAPPEALVIDTDSLSLSPANEGSLEDCQPEVEATPLPNLDHLEIIESKEEKTQGKAQFKLSDD